MNARHSGQPVLALSPGLSSLSAVFGSGKCSNCIWLYSSSEIAEREVPLNARSLSGNGAMHVAKGDIDTGRPTRKWEVLRIAEIFYG